MNEQNKPNTNSSEEQKSAFSQLEKNFCQKAFQVLGENWEKEYASLLLCTFNDRNEEEKRKMQEAHNSGHALTFFTFAVNSAIEGTTGGNVQLRAFKTMGHLLCLREFILPEQKMKRIIINRLFEAIRLEFPDTKKKWTRFLMRYWQEITIFAHYYKHNACFPQESYLKICDLVNGIQIFTLWWWKLKVKKFVRKTPFLKAVFCNRGK